MNDWNTGKIKYCTQPPEVVENKDVHVSASIVHAEAREFDVENFEDMETELLNNFDVKKDDVMEITSTGPVEYKAPEDDEEEEEAESGPQPLIDESELHSKGKKRKLDGASKKEKADPTMELVGRCCICNLNYFSDFIIVTFVIQETKPLIKTSRSS